MVSLEVGEQCRPDPEQSGGSTEEKVGSMRAGTQSCLLAHGFPEPGPYLEDSRHNGYLLIKFTSPCNSCQLD